MSNQLAHLLNTIQYKTGKSLQEIAVSIGYSRPHLNKAKLYGTGAPKIEGLLREKFRDVLQNVPQETVSAPNKETRLSGEEAWFRRLDQLIENNRMLSEAQLLLAEHISSGKAAKDALVLLEEGPGPKDATQRPSFSGKQGIDSGKTRVKGKGNV